LLVTNLTIEGLVPTRTITLSQLRTAKHDAMRAAVNFMLNTEGGFVMTRRSFAAHTDVTAKTYRPDAFDAVRDQCVEVTFTKADGQRRPSKALILKERAVDAQAIIERIEGCGVIIKGSTMAELAPAEGA
jgi:hypothetical protein